MTKRQPIPFKITHGVHQPVIFVEAWFPGPGSDAGYLRTFDSHDWARAAAYCHELQAGKLSGQF